MDFLVKGQSHPLKDLHDRHKKAARFFGVSLGEAEIDETMTVSPIVNHGRWIVRCPWCASAELASDLYFCSQGCFNGKVGRKYVRVTWPKQREAIEAVLLKRPDPQTRNWTSETIDELARENKEHGL
jgi:hypothetical protein